MRLPEPDDKIHAPDEDVPLLMVVLMLLAVRPAVMGPFVIGRRLCALGWFATAVMAASVVAMFAFD